MVLTSKTGADIKLALKAVIEKDGNQICNTRY